MRICTLKPEITSDGVLIFKAETPAQKTTFDKIPNIGKELLDLSKQRFIIRKASKNDKHKLHVTFKTK